jgi:hypothetical protein
MSAIMDIMLNIRSTQILRSFKTNCFHPVPILQLDLLLTITFTTMIALFFIILSVAAWVLTGIWTLNWLEPVSFIQIIVWLLIWQFIAGVVGAIFSFLGVYSEND